MNKVKEIFGKIFTEFGEGFPGEYAFTGIAGLFFGVLAAFGLTGGGADQEMLAFWVFAIIGGIMILIGVVKTLGNKDHTSKPYALVVHVLVFILSTLLTKFLVPVLITLVILAIAVVFFSGGSIGTIVNGSGSQHMEQPRDEKKVEVWRENGMMRENLKVNSTGDMYYDPEDGEWHKIQK